ncbi:MAG: lasso peptide, partial [Geitlerinemataceae cyanobacterium]
RRNLMKNYSAPQLTVHGNVKAITQAFGSQTKADMVLIGGSNVTPGSTQGSVDGIIVPNP